jgi:hypothetical protein
MLEQHEQLDDTHGSKTSHAWPFARCPSLLDERATCRDRALRQIRALITILIMLGTFCKHHGVPSLGAKESPGTCGLVAFKAPSG